MKRSGNTGVRLVFLYETVRGDGLFVFTQKPALTGTAVFQNPIEK